MADTPSDSSNGASDKPTEEELLTAEKNKVAEQVVNVLNESELVWTQISEKQLILHRLYSEQILVSETFTEYNETWRNFECSNTSNIDITEIDHEVQELLQILTDFETKLDNTGGMVKSLIRKMRVHMGTLRNSLGAVVVAKSLVELSNVDIPNLDWIQAIPDPEIETLADEWSEADLHPKILYFLHQLQHSVQPSGGNSPELNFGRVDIVVDDSP